MRRPLLDGVGEAAVRARADGNPPHRLALGQPRQHFGGQLGKQRAGKDAFDIAGARRGLGAARGDLLDHTGSQSKRAS